jgi:hypothetical protein
MAHPYHHALSNAPFVRRHNAPCQDPEDPQRSQARVISVILRTVEVLCFVTALSFIIPPRLPHSATLVDAALVRTASILTGGGLFVVSLYLSILRDAENRVTFAVKLVCYILLVWLAFERLDLPMPSPPLVYPRAANNDKPDAALLCQASTGNAIMAKDHDFHPARVTPADLGIVSRTRC